MRKLSLVFTICTLLLLSQSGYTQDIPLGVKAGPNFSKVRVDPGTDPDGKTGFHFGLYTNFEVSNTIEFQPEVLVSFKGNENANLTYLVVPLVFKYYAFDQFSLHAGLQPGFLIGAEDDAEDNLTGIELGIPFGAEFDINDELGIGTRYVIGVTNISDIDGSRTDIFNRNFQLFLTYNLPVSLN